MNIEDTIINKLLEHDERFERLENNMVTKDEARHMTDILEGIATRVKNRPVAKYAFVTKLEDFKRKF